MRTEDLISKRKLLGLSQQKLAEYAGISLPTVQNIESGQGNPSLDILDKVSKVLGFEIDLRPRKIDWDLLAAFGVPLSSGKKSTSFKQNPQTLSLELRKALFESIDLPPDRKIEALAATFLALKTHWPTLYKDLGSSRKTADRLIGKQCPDRLLKLRRLAIENLQVYL